MCVAYFADHRRDEIYNLVRAIVPRVWTGYVSWPTQRRPPLASIASFSDNSVWFGPGMPFPYFAVRSQIPQFVGVFLQGLRSSSRALSLSLSYRLLGRRGSLSWVRNAGVWPVDSDVVVFTASIISSHFSSQFLWSCPANCAILTVLFARLVGFSCGVYGAVNCCLVPISARKLLKIRLANCTPLSVMTTFGTPYLSISTAQEHQFRPFRKSVYHDQ